MSTMTVIQEVEFSMDDIDNEVYFEVLDNNIVYGSDTLKGVFDVIVKSDWFVEGNKTEGLLSIGNFVEGLGIEMNLIWKSITMGEDWDSDEEEEHEKDFYVYFNKYGFHINPK